MTVPSDANILTEVNTSLRIIRFEVRAAIFLSTVLFAVATMLYNWRFMFANGGFSWPSFEAPIPDLLATSVGVLAFSGAITVAQQLAVPTPGDSDIVRAQRLAWFTTISAATRLSAYAVLIIVPYGWWTDKLRTEWLSECLACGVSVLAFLAASTLSQWVDTELVQLSRYDRALKSERLARAAIQSVAICGLRRPSWKAITIYLSAPTFAIVVCALIIDLAGSPHRPARAFHIAINLAIVTSLSRAIVITLSAIAVYHYANQPSKVQKWTLAVVLAVALGTLGVVILYIRGHAPVGQYFVLAVFLFSTLELFLLVVGAFRPSRILSIPIHNLVVSRLKRNWIESYDRVCRTVPSGHSGTTRSNS